MALSLKGSVHVYSIKSGVVFECFLDGEIVIMGSLETVCIETRNALELRLLAVFPSSQTIPLSMQSLQATTTALH